MPHLEKEDTSHKMLLGQCEAIIQEGLKRIEKVERAFAIIEQMQLYKNKSDDFETYYQENWAMKMKLFSDLPQPYQIKEINELPKST